jgi:hypothetical protein
LATDLRAIGQALAAQKARVATETVLLGLRGLRAQLSA